ncbi:protein white isoform X2 [Nematostella vectensis]|uniref:protein white isoform X2 n=1 Tax=Nematostella vectensis TaxID=45351 RepID=UPI0020774A88|nr:protein white isoform X2 [Nematostella vectensis]
MDTPTRSTVIQIKEYSHAQKSVTLEWRDINVLVPVESGKVYRHLCCKTRVGQQPRSKQILFNVSGKVNPGELVAVMGASGSGKTTLINVLAHRNIGSMHVSGVVKANNKTLGLAINSISAYIQQEDLFIGTLTVREHLKFQLGLVKCADSLIGTPGHKRGISGGEQKRLSFASEILTDPSILFADEPTSGLDSFMAQSVVATLQKLAAQGRTIICTIHQPSSEVYNMFSSLLLVAEGRTAYFGLTRDVIPHFSSLGYPCPPNYNPADYFVHTLAVVPDDRQNCLDRIKTICDATTNRNPANVHDLEDSFMEAEWSHEPYKASWWRQFKTVMWRSWLSNRRDVLMFRIRILQSIFMGLLAGLVYLQTNIDADSIQNISGALFFLITTLAFSSLQAVYFVFPIELPVFLRDHKNGMYRTDVYFLCKTLTELPIFIISPFLISVIPYWMIGLQSEFTRFLICFVVLMLVTNTAVSIGYMISTMMKSTAAAGAIGPPILVPFLLFGGFFLKSTSIPVYFVWIEYTSFFKYSFELLSINQWQGHDSIGACQMYAGNRTAPAAGICFPDGDSILAFLGLDKDMYVVDFVVLIALSVGFRLLAFILLLRRSSMKQ